MLKPPSVDTLQLQIVFIVPATDEEGDDSDINQDDIVSYLLIKY